MLDLVQALPIQGPPDPQWGGISNTQQPPGCGWSPFPRQVQHRICCWAQSLTFPSRATACFKA